MKKRPHILITNDDGIHAPGIKHLVNALKGLADLSIVAPATEQSCIGLALTLRSPLVINQIEWEGAESYSVTGTPADCVKMALRVILRSPPDLIVSGINRGGNQGRSLLYSGTVGGVIEAVFQGIGGIAFSSFDYEETEYLAFEPYILKITDYILKNSLPTGTLLNVNFPSHTIYKNRNETVFGVKLTRQGREFWVEDPKAHSHNTYMLGCKLLQFEEHEESDTYWLARGYITACPVHVDELTDGTYLKRQKSHFEENFQYT